MLGGHRVASQHVVAIDLDSWNTESGSTKIKRHNSLCRNWRANCPLVVLTEKHQGSFCGGSKKQRFADIALGGCAIAEVGDYCLINIRVSGSDISIEVHAHGVAGGVKHLGSKHDGVKVESGFFRVPSAVVYTAHDLDD